MLLARRIFQSDRELKITEDLIETVNRKLSELDCSTKTSVVIQKGRIIHNGGSYFVKRLNAEKLKRLYPGDYGALWSEYMQRTYSVVTSITVAGMIELSPGDYLEISEFCPTVIDDVAETLTWEQIRACFERIILSVEALGQQCQGHKEGRVSTGIDTAFWNFSQEGQLIDFNPPRIEMYDETIVFSRPGEPDHFKMLEYRTMTIEGMMLNALATVIMKSTETTTLAERGIITRSRIDELVDVMYQITCRCRGKRLGSKIIRLIKDGDMSAAFPKHPANIIVQLRNTYSL